jgi:hypothetical protein
MKGFNNYAATLHVSCLNYSVSKGITNTSGVSITHYMYRDIQYKRNRCNFSICFRDCVKLISVTLKKELNARSVEFQNFPAAIFWIKNNKVKEKEDELSEWTG